MLIPYCLLASSSTHFAFSSILSPFYCHSQLFSHPPSWSAPPAALSFFLPPLIFTLLGFSSSLFSWFSVQEVIRCLKARLCSPLQPSLKQLQWKWHHSPRSLWVMHIWKGHLSCAGQPPPASFRPNVPQCLHGAPSAHTVWIDFTAITGGLMKEQAWIKQLEEPSHFCWGNRALLLWLHCGPHHHDDLWGRKANFTASAEQVQLLVPHRLSAWHWKLISVACLGFLPQELGYLSPEMGAREAIQGTEGGQVLWEGPGHNCLSGLFQL